MWASPDAPQENPSRCSPWWCCPRSFRPPSSIPDIREFVRHSLADSPLTDEDNREVSQTVFRSPARRRPARPASIQVSFRIFREHVEVDVLHSHLRGGGRADTLAQLREVHPPSRPPSVDAEDYARHLRGWMSEVLRAAKGSPRRRRPANSACR
jgi:hypothetical protein